MFLVDSGVCGDLIAQASWEDKAVPKRAIVQMIVNILVRDQQRYGDLLMSLFLALYGMEDPVWLRRVRNDGERLYQTGVASLRAFKQQAKPLADLQREQRVINERHVLQNEHIEQRADLNRALDTLNLKFKAITGELSAQQRGYALERFLPDLFHLFDIEARGSFKIEGEQIDGAFRLGDTDYILEAKWHEKQTPRSDLVYFESKVGTKLENTLGLFISMNGFESSAISNRGGRRPDLILMDGADIAAVLEGRIGLPKLIDGKKQHAAQTGEIMISAFQLI
jgi:hypothetical protein